MARTMTLSVQASGNCNFAYMTGLRSYRTKDMPDVVAWIFGQRKGDDIWGNKPDIRTKPTISLPTYGILIFAQGSEDDIKKMPYAPEFRDYILENSLGTVIETGGIPNYLHNNKEGYMYAWSIDRKAVTKWFEEHVVAPWEKEDKKKKEEQAKKDAEVKKLKKQLEEV